MRRLILIGGGNHKEKTTEKIDDYIISLTNKNKPRILFIPTASKDEKRVIDNFNILYNNKAIIDVICIYDSYFKDEAINKINLADIIYIGGGNTDLLIDTWRKTGFDELIINAYQNGKIVAGISAGAICFFEYGYSDKYAFNDNGYCNFNVIKCLGVIDGICCPHYNYEGKEIFNEVVKKMGIKGFAIEDDTALCVFDDLYFSYKANSKNSVYLIDNDKILKEV